MMHKMKRFGFFILALLLLASGCPVHAQNDELAAQHKSFQVSPGGSLDIDAEYARIEIKGAAGVTVDIKATLTKHFATKIVQRGNDVHVTSRCDCRFWHRVWYQIFVHETPHFVVTVPLQYHLNLRTSGGDINVDGLEGSIRAGTSGGELRFSNIAGSVAGATSGGKIKMSVVRGDVHLRTSGGSISIDRVDGRIVAETSGGGIEAYRVTGSIEAQTSGGTITATIAKQPISDCRLSTTGGGIIVGLPGEVSLDIDAATTGGQVSSDFPVFVRGGGILTASSLQGRINGGGPRLWLRTTGGDIRIKSK